MVTPSTGDRRSHFREPLQRSLRDFKDLIISQRSKDFMHIISMFSLAVGTCYAPINVLPHHPPRVQVGLYRGN